MKSSCVFINKKIEGRINISPPHTGITQGGVLVLLLDDPVKRSPIKGYVVSLLKMAAILDFSTSR